MNVQQRLRSSEIVPYVFDLFETTCVKQFQSIDREITRVNSKAQDTGELCSAHISATNEDMMTTLLLRIPRQTLINTLPRMGDMAPYLGEELLLDWHQELCNRLLGRLKNKLLDHECLLRMGLPPHVCPKDYLDTWQQQPGKKICYAFELEGAVIECHLCVNLLNPDLVMSLYEDEDEDWFDESELQNL